MKFRALTIEERAATGGMTHRLDWDVSDIPAGLAAAAAQTYSTLPLPVFKNNSVVKAEELYCDIPLANTADAAFNSTTVSVGDTGSATKFFSAVQLNANGSPVKFSIPGTANQVYTADTQMVLTINSMAAKSLSNLNVGKFYVLFAIENAADPARVKATPFAGGGYT